MADPVLAPPGEAPVYRPLAMLAIVGLILASLYAVIIVIGALTSFFRSSPLFLPDWLLVLAVAGFILSYLGARQIRNSEGTRAGQQLARAGLWLSVVFGLTYFVYVRATVLAVTQQADNFLLQRDVDSGFFPRLLAANDPKELFQAYLLSVSPALRQGADTDKEAEMLRQFNAPGPDGAPGPLTGFRDQRFVQMMVFAGPEARVDSLAIQFWKFDQESYHVARIYRITTPEGVREVSLRVQSVEALEAGQRRKWLIDPTRIVEVAAPKLTTLGEKIEKYRQSAAAHAKVLIQNVKAGKGFDFKDKDATDWVQATPDPAQRESLRTFLATHFAKGGGQQFELQAAPVEETFIPWEQADARLRLTLPAVLRTKPDAADGTSYLADLRIVLEAKDDPTVAEHAIQWDVHQVYLKFGGLMKAPKGKG